MLKTDMNKFETNIVNVLVNLGTTYSIMCCMCMCKKKDEGKKRWG